MASPARAILAVLELLSDTAGADHAQNGRSTDIELPSEQRRRKQYRKDIEAGERLLLNAQPVLDGIDNAAIEHAAGSRRSTGGNGNRIG